MILALLRDTARSLRSWRRTPGAAALVVMALGLSGGALIALVSLINALFWRELPVPHPGELVSVSGITGRPGDGSWIPVSLFAPLEHGQRVFQTLAGVERLDATAVVDDSTTRLTIEGVSGRYFDTLGVHAEAGRVVDARDVESASAVVAISFQCWRTHFGSDPHVVGRMVRLHGTPVTVIGVASPAFRGLDVGASADAWVPASLVSRLEHQPPALSGFQALVGRLRPGVTRQQASREIETLWPAARQAAAASVPESPVGFRDYVLALRPQLESATRGLSSSGYRAFFQRPLLLLALSSAVTILLACANLSGLLLARWSTRVADLAVQAALGASNGRLASQVVAESLALSMIAVVACAPLALWSARGLTLLVWNQSEGVAPLDLSPDYRILGVMVLLAGVVAVCVSILPVSRIWSAKLTLMRSTRGLPGRSVTQWGRALATAQVALSVPLLVTAWVVAANLHRLQGVNTGFRPDGVVVVSTTLQSGVAPAEDPVAYLTRLAAALRATPGVVAATLSSSEPICCNADWRRKPLSTSDGLRLVRPFVVQASPGYFDTLSVPLIAGRDFAWTDDRAHANVAVLPEGVAKALFPDGSPIGQRVRLGGQPDRDLEVIGVVADAALAEPHATNQLFLFTSLLQQESAKSPEFSPLVLLRSPLEASSIEPLARHAIVALGRHDVGEVHPLRHTLDAALIRERVMRLGAWYFAGLTTLLVFVGLYSVLNLGLVRRVPEIGLRLALGATPHDIRLTVVREAAVTTAIGLALGIPCALLSGHVIASSLTLVGSHDAFGFLAAIALVLGITLGSMTLPLRRASRVTPMEALSRH